MKYVLAWLCLFVACAAADAQEIVVQTRVRTYTRYAAFADGYRTLTLFIFHEQPTPATWPYPWPPPPSNTWCENAQGYFRPVRYWERWEMAVPEHTPAPTQVK